MFNEIYKLVGQFEKINKVAVAQYTPIVDEIIKHKERDVNKICFTLDYLLDYAGSEKGLLLFKRLCAYLYTLDPQATAEYILMYRERYEDDVDAIDG